MPCMSRAWAGLLAALCCLGHLAWGQALAPAPALAACNATECSLPQFNGTATSDPEAPVGISQYDPAVLGPSANYTPWQIHLLPGQLNH